MGRANVLVGHGGRAGLLVAGNALPLVGVAVWEWNLSALLVLYGIEGVVTAAIASLKMLFAERLPSVRMSATDLPFPQLREKRGGVAVLDGLPPVYPRNLPFTLGMTGTFLFAWAVPGALVLADALAALSDAVSLTVLVSGLGLVATRLAEFRTEYVGRGEYADVSARAVAATPVRQFLLVVCLLPLLASLGESRTAGTLSLFIVVVVKTLADGYGFWVDHLGGEPHRLGERLFGNVETGEPPPTVDVPDDPPDERLGTDTAAVLFSGLVPVALTFVSQLGVFSLLLVALAVLVVGVEALLVGVAVVGVLAGASLLTHYLRYGTLEYQRRGDAFVCYDTWLDEPQWACDVDAVRDPSVERRITSRLFGTSVVTFAADWSDESTRRVGPVADARELPDRFGFPPFDASQADADRTVAVAALGLVGCFLTVPVGMLAAPSVSTGQVIAVVILLGPMMAVLVGALLWVSLYNA
ncbi:DUF6498-containing protein [Halorussus halobius]|uniref:DUF6498-containing protein n=1 Tax=Halorussus halobius TaxID=1710537 RepID=UPI001092DFEC|nr:DUF6498-containing protein [Halorussus halobius]